MSTMFSYELVADGNYHTVEILAIKKNFTLRVDGGLARSIVNEGPNEFLNVHTPLYLAGVPQETGTKAWKQWHLRNTTSFIGKDIVYVVFNVYLLVRQLPCTAKVQKSYAGCVK